MSVVVGLAVLAVSAGCTGHPPARAATGVASTPTSSAASLLGKPLLLPKMATGATCPVTPVSNARVPVATPRGGPNFYLGGPPPRGGYAWNKAVYALVGVHGPVLLRGGRLDGPGTMKFDGSPAAGNDPGETVSAPAGVTSTFHSAILVPGGNAQSGSAADALYIFPSSPGCYVMQADGADFEGSVVILAPA